MRLSTLRRFRYPLQIGSSLTPKKASTAMPGEQASVSASELAWVLSRDHTLGAATARPTVRCNPQQPIRRGAGQRFSSRFLCCTPSPQWPSAVVSLLSESLAVGEWRPERFGDRTTTDLAMDLR